MGSYERVAARAAPVELEITRGDGVRLRRARGTRVTVQEGSIWITQHGSAEDVCLDAGKSFRITRNGLTLVTAVAPSVRARVILTPTHRFALPRARLRARIATWLGSMQTSPARRPAGSL